MLTAMRSADGLHEMITSASATNGGQQQCKSPGCLLGLCTTTECLHAHPDLIDLRRKLARLTGGVLPFVPLKHVNLEILCVELPANQPQPVQGASNTARSPSPTTLGKDGKGLVFYSQLV